MFKWISLAIVVAAIGLYFSGALEFENSSDSVNVVVDKDKAKEAAESLKEKLQE